MDKFVQLSSLFLKALIIDLGAFSSLTAIINQITIQLIDIIGIKFLKVRFQGLKI